MKFLKYSVVESCEVEFTMQITDEDAEHLKGLDDRERSSWLQDRNPDYKTGLYDEVRQKEWILDSDPPYDIKIQEEQCKPLQEPNTLKST